MKIEIISIDGMAMAAEAWRLSRDVEANIEWQDICTVDGPVNEFPSAVCHFRDFTILEREIFASSRTHVMWARTSFVDAPDKYQVPLDLLMYINHDYHREIREKMETGKASGLHQDEWRRSLPVSATTCFTMRISYRDAIKFSKYFMYLRTLVSSVLRDRFLDIANELAELVDKFTGSASLTAKAMRTMNLSKFLHEGMANADPGVTRCDDVYIGKFTVPFWIRAHFIRHRPITVIDNLFKIMQLDEILDLTISTPVEMQVAAGEQIWVQLLKSRSCWLTQSTLSKEKDPWQEIVDQFTDEFGTSLLPCSDGICPHHRDARNRLEGTDPGVPCVRYSILNNISFDRDRDRIEKALASRSQFWTDMYHEATN